ncbi:MAG TPA: HD domain-containing protein [Bacteroides sp.]|nr:HD domain-containing protein [Bacteroides sp.]
MSDPIIEKTVDFVRQQLAGAEGGHDWSHIERVWKMAGFIREQEGQGDRMTIDLAALLHDIADPKFNDGDEEKGAALAFDFLTGNGLDLDRAGHIRSIIRYVSYRGGLPQDHIQSIEFQIVQDADRLDAMGAIGIARAFNYGGHKNRPIYDPGVPVREYADPSAYHASAAPTINHFHEKLLRLKALMNTETGKKIARERHAFMLQFLEQFHREADFFRRENSG